MLFHLSELQHFCTNPSNEYHIVRHYTKVDTSYKTMLADNDYWYYHHGQQIFLEWKITYEDIELALQTRGWSFYPNVAWIETPKKLINLAKYKLEERIRNWSLYRELREKDRMVFFDFDYWSIVWEENVCLYNNLTEIEKSELKVVSRSSHVSEKDSYIKVTHRGNKVQTTYITVQIHDTWVLPFYFLTAYPRGLRKPIKEGEAIVFLE